MAAPLPPSPQQAQQQTTNSPTNKPTTSMKKPTYLSIKHSSEYLAAKSQLTAGELENALTLIGGQIEHVRQLLTTHTTCASTAATNDAAEDGNIDQHEAMAPLLYLYGTTLLYLVEENESMMSAGGMTQVR